MESVPSRPKATVPRDENLRANLGGGVRCVKEERYAKVEVMSSSQVSEAG
jgi:hypothetical protein